MTKTLDVRLTEIIGDLIPHFADMYNGVPIRVIEPCVKSLDPNVKVFRTRDDDGERWVHYEFTDGTTITFGDSND